MRIVWLVAAAGCATSYQSARTLPPGKTQVTVGLGRVMNTQLMSATEEVPALYVGDLQIRSGLAERVDVGARIQRTPGVGDTAAMASIEPKMMLTPSRDRVFVSAAVGAGVLWIESGDDFDALALVGSAALYAGTDLAPGLELVASPKLYASKIDGSADTQVDCGGSLGLRFSDGTRTWALQPELGFFHHDADGESDTAITFGFAIAAGN